MLVWRELVRDWFGFGGWLLIPFLILIVHPLIIMLSSFHIKVFIYLRKIDENKLLLLLLLITKTILVVGKNMRLCLYMCVCGFFLSVKFATSQLALLTGG